MNSRMLDKAKIVFDPKELRFSFHADPTMVEQWDEPPMHLLETAIKTRSDDKDAAAQAIQIKHCALYLDRLKPVWNAYKVNPRLPPVNVTIAEAYPAMPGVQLDFDLAKNDRIFLSLPPEPDMVRSWHPSWIEAYINHRLVSSELLGQVNSAQLKVSYARAAFFGERVESAPLIVLPRSNPLKFGKLYQILVSPQRLEIEVLVGDVVAFQSESLREQLYQELDAASWNLLQAEYRSPFFRNMQRSLAKSLDNALHQPYALGLNLPLVLSGGFFLREEREAPFLSSLKSSELALELQDQGRSTPRTCLGSAHFSSHETLMRRRGLLKSEAGREDSLSLGVSYFPALSLTKGAAPASQELLSFAKQSRASYPPSQRELQALTFAIPGQAWEKYKNAAELFWREFMRDFRQSQGADSSMTLFSQHFPISLPRTHAKPKAAVTRPGSHDAAAWLPMIVREVVALPFVSGDPVTIASYLAPDISAAAVGLALDGLLKGGLLEFDSFSRRYVQKAKNLMTGDDKQMEKIRRFHEEISELAEAMIEVKHEETQSLAFRLPIAAHRFEEARTRIRRWIHDVLEQSNAEGQPDQVFQLTVQMFKNADEV